MQVRFGQMARADIDAVVQSIKGGSRIAFGIGTLWSNNPSNTPQPPQLAPANRPCNAEDAKKERGR
jgi:hypothetical protein